jgi:hypothetical protein
MTYLVVAQRPTYHSLWSDLKRGVHCWHVYAADIRSAPLTTADKLESGACTCPQKPALRSRAP